MNDVWKAGHVPWARDVAARGPGRKVVTSRARRDFGWVTRNVLPLMDSGGASLQYLPPGLDAEPTLRTPESQPSTDAGPLKGIMI